MKRFLLTTSILAALGLPVSSVFAQATSKVVSTCASQSYTAGTPQYPTMATTGDACVSGTGGTGTVATQVQGNVASGVSDAGTNPVKVGGVFNTTQPTVTNGQRVDWQMTARGEGMIEISNNSIVAVIRGSADGQTGQNGLVVAPQTQLFNGSTWDRAVTIQGAASSGLGTAAVAIAPTSSANASIAPTTNTAVGSSQVLKASAGNAYRYAITTAASAGFLMVFDATAAPADGAVTPKICRAVAANTSLELNHAEMPDKFTTGVVEVFSTTGCFTKTASATAELEGWVQ